MVDISPPQPVGKTHARKTTQRNALSNIFKNLAKKLVAPVQSTAPLQTWNLTTGGISVSGGPKWPDSDWRTDRRRLTAPITASECFPWGPTEGLFDLIENWIRMPEGNFNLFISALNSIQLKCKYWPIYLNLTGDLSNLRSPVGDKGNDAAAVEDDVDNDSLGGGSMLQGALCNCENSPLLIVDPINMLISYDDSITRSLLFIADHHHHNIDHHSIIIILFTISIHFGFLVHLGCISLTLVHYYIIVICITAMIKCAI